MIRKTPPTEGKTMTIILIVHYLEHLRLIRFGESKERIRDLIVPGSVRVERVTHEWTLMTIRCGQCGNEFEVLANRKASRCKRCWRFCRYGQAPTTENVTPLRGRRTG